MKLWRSSLSEDSVDRYNHTWSVLLFLLLALVTWLLPLVTMTSPSLLEVMGGDSPHVEVSCKQPYGADQYDLKVCRNAMEQLLADPHSSQEDVKLYPMDTTVPLNISGPDQARVQKMEEFLSLHRAKQDARSDLKTTLFLWTPLFLFVVAFCLKVPHIMWNLLSTCCNDLNIDQVLKTAKTRHSLDQESSRQLRDDLAHSLKDAFKNRKSSVTTVSYLLMKLLMTAAALVGFLIILLLVLQELDQSNDSVHAVGVDKDQAAFMACEVHLVQVDNVRTIGQQCLFTVSLDVQSLLTLASIYRTVLIAATVYLLSLLFVNLVSLFTWIFSLLCNGCREEQRGSVSLDGYFLLAMARLNAGLLVTRDIALALSGKAEV